MQQKVNSRNIPGKYIKLQFFLRLFVDIVFTMYLEFPITTRQ